MNEQQRAIGQRILRIVLVTGLVLSWLYLFDRFWG